MAKEPMCFVGGNGTRCRIANPLWVDAVAADVTKALEPFIEASMVVTGYTPPWPSEQPDGFVLVELSREELTAAVGIAFGFQNGGVVEREGFDVGAWLTAPNEPHSSGIIVANFDEAWRLVCRIGEALRVPRIELCYGL